MKKIVEKIKSIAKDAGEAILEIYENRDFLDDIDYKADDSPLTEADKASHQVIVRNLAQIDHDWPILSEEGAHTPYEERQRWNTFWLVDPLDGTKEFIKRNGEFTVNIALIKSGYPVLGVIYVPVKDQYFFSDGDQAYLQEGGGPAQAIYVEPTPDTIVAVRSRSHAAPEEEALLKKYGVQDTISCGSSLKFCQVAMGNAQVYYRHGPTMEWDTAAGQAIVEAAGGKVYTGDDAQSRFVYNKPNLRNGSFLCLGIPANS